MNPAGWTFTDLALKIGAQLGLRSENVRYFELGRLSSVRERHESGLAGMFTSQGLSRDARFDGKFFIGVIGSGVYGCDGYFEVSLDERRRTCCADSIWQSPLAVLHYRTNPRDV